MNESPRARPVILKTAVVHTVTYFISGFAAMMLYDYGSLYSESALNLLMRPTDHPLVIAGVLFQPLRGVLFGFVFWLIRETWYETRRGWLVLWAVLAVVGILSPFGPAPGSIEGLVFTVLPLSSHLAGQLEVYSQSLLLALLTWAWVRNPGKRWMTVMFIVLFGAAVTMAVLGIIFTQTGV